MPILGRIDKENSGGSTTPDNRTVKWNIRVPGATFEKVVDSRTWE